MQFGDNNGVIYGETSEVKHRLDYSRTAGWCLGGTGSMCLLSRRRTNSRPQLLKGAGGAPCAGAFALRLVYHTRKQCWRHATERELRRVRAVSKESKIQTKTPWGVSRNSAQQQLLHASELDYLEQGATYAVFHKKGNIPPPRGSLPRVYPLNCVGLAPRSSARAMGNQPAAACEKSRSRTPIENNRASRTGRGC